MHLRSQVIQHPNLMPCLQKSICKMRPDETGAARYKDLLAHSFIPFRSCSVGGEGHVRGGVTLHSPTGKIGELLVISRWTGVVLFKAKVLRRKAKSQ